MLASTAISAARSGYIEEAIKHVVTVVERPRVSVDELSSALIASVIASAAELSPGSNDSQKGRSMVFRCVKTLNDIGPEARDALIRQWNIYRLNDNHRTILLSVDPSFAEVFGGAVNDSPSTAQVGSGG
jgi:hypothetical protein